MSLALYILGAAVIIFTAVCIERFLVVAREAAEERAAVEKWYAERQAYRTSSSIADDSPESESDPSGRAA